MEIVRNAPGAFSLILLNAMVEGSDIAPEYYDAAVEIVEGLTTVIMMAAYGDERAKSQIKAIEKLVKPDKFELPLSKIKELVDRYETSPQLARGWELLRLMSSLSWVVEPLKKDRPFSPDQPITVRNIQALEGRADLMKVVREHWKPNTTLQSLAIRTYLEHLQRQGVTDEYETITERTLKRDLARVREWEQRADENEKLRRGRWQGHSLSDSPIFWCYFSEGWKTRRRNRAPSKAHEQEEKDQTRRGVKQSKK